MEVEKLTTNSKGDHERSDVNQKYGTLFNGFLSILITLNNHASLTQYQESVNISRKRSPESGDIIGVTGIGRPHASMACPKILVEVIKWIKEKNIMLWFQRWRWGQRASPSNPFAVFFQQETWELRG